MRRTCAFRSGADRALQRLAVGLQAVAGLMQQPVHCVFAHGMSRAVARPSQRSHRVAARPGIETRLKGCNQLRIVDAQRLAPAPGRTKPRRRLAAVVLPGLIQVPQPRPDRRARQICRVHNAPDPAGFHRRPPAAAALIETPSECRELGLRCRAHRSFHSELTISNLLETNDLFWRKP